MKSTIVPAQITTVEDKIAGSLTLSQLLLLAAPVFGGAILYILFPPNLRFTPYKIGVSGILLLAFSLMAIRVKGKILLLWAIILARYNLRPRYHIYDKNETHLRDASTEPAEEEAADIPGAEQTAIAALPQLSIADTVQLERLLANPQANVTFVPTKKGGLHVTFTEVE
ncbi:MAG TPA: hypothetical protein VGG13_00120 [Candidatus Saccharimonadales bacterium]|jgi:hypothetical protein